MASTYKTNAPSPDISVIARIINAIAAWIKKYSNQRSDHPEEYYRSMAYDRYRADKMVKAYMDRIKRQTYSRRII